MHRREVTAYVGLGANLGAAEQAVCDASAALNGVSGVRLVRMSRLYRTAPIGANGPDYVNAVAEIATQLTAPHLLKVLQSIEMAAGRERPYVNAPRTLDLDLLLFGSGRIASVDLVIPHPRMRQRAFVLIPLSEIAPGRVLEQDLQSVKNQGIELLDGDA